MTDIEEFNANLKKAIKKTEEELPKLKKELETKLIEFGSVELMANLAMRELLVQNPKFHNVNNPMSENPFVVYLLGLFLQKNNLRKTEPHPNQVTEIINTITKYFDSFKWIMMPMDPDNRNETDSLVVSSRLNKLFGDANPHCYPDQKYDLVKTTFSSISNFLETKFGFSINDALHYESKIEARIGRKLYEKSKEVHEIVENAKKDLNEHGKDEFLKQIEKDGWTLEQYITFFGNTHFFWDSKNILVINPEDFCKSENISDVKKFENYLNTFSCQIGDQFEDFENPLSDNIIFYKPIIKIDETSFFIPKPDLLKLNAL